MTNQFFKEDGSLDVAALENETKRIVLEKQKQEERNRFQERINYLNESFEYDFFDSNRFINAVFKIEGLEGYQDCSAEQKAIFDYLAQHQYMGYDDMEDAQFNELMGLVIKAIASGVVSFDYQEKMFYHTSEISPSEIAASRDEEQSKSVKSWWVRQFNRIFG